MRKFTAVPGKGIFASEEYSSTQRYRVWYNPYGLDGNEEDYIDVEAIDESEARRKGSASGHVTEIELIESSESAVKASEDRYHEPYRRWMVKITPYISRSHPREGLYKFDYIDRHWDTSGYCFFTYEDGYEHTDFASISEARFNQMFDKSMKPGKVYEIITAGVYDEDVIDIKEVPEHWFPY